MASLQSHSLVIAASFLLSCEAMLSLVLASGNVEGLVLSRVPQVEAQQCRKWIYPGINAQTTLHFTGEGGSDQHMLPN